MRWSEIAASRTTSAVGHGTIPAEMPIPSSPCRCACVVVMVAVVVAVLVVVVMVVRVLVVVPQAQPPAEDRRRRRPARAPRRRGSATDRAAPARRTPRARASRARARRRRPCASRSRSRRARPRRAAGRASRSGSRHDRLPVAGAERVRGAPEQRERERDEDEAERRSCEMRLSNRPPARGGAAPVSVGAAPGASPGRTPARAAAGRAGWSAGPAGTCGAAALGLVAGTPELRISRAVVGADDDLAPADARPGSSCRGSSGSAPRGRRRRRPRTAGGQPPCPGALLNLARQRPQGGAAAVDLEHERRASAAPRSRRARTRSPSWKVGISARSRTARR